MVRKKSTPLSIAQKRLWELCKQITRKRWGYNCFTCGVYVEFPHTGHFITDATCSTELSYDLDNLRPQCYPCNIHKSGNWVAFKQRLENEYGRKWVDALIHRNEKTKGLQYDILWYRQKVQEYEKILSDDRTN